MHKLTGIPCPTCGVTRALCHATQGHWSRSLAYHPGGIPLAAVLAVYALWAGAEARQGKVLMESARGRLARVLPMAAVLFFAVVWVLRLL